MDEEIRMGIIRRRVAYHGVGTRSELSKLFSGVRVPTDTIFKIVNGQISRPQRAHLSSMENSLDRRDNKREKSDPKEAEVDITIAQSREIEATRKRLEELLTFEDLEPFAEFAEVPLKQLCWIRGGRHRTEGILEANRQIVEHLDLYLVDKKERTVSQNDTAGSSNGHQAGGALKGIHPMLQRSYGHDSSRSPSALAVVETQPEGQNGQTSSGGRLEQRPAEQLELVKRMEELGATKPRSPQKRVFLRASGLTQITMVKFVEGDGWFQSATLEKVKLGLKQVEAEFPPAINQSDPTDDQIATVETEAVTEVTSTPPHGDAVATDVLTQVAELLSVPLDDQYFVSMLSSNLSAMVRLGQGQINGVELKAVTLTDRLHWRMNIGDVDLP